MKYPKEYLDEIKTMLKVSTVVSKTVALKKRGKEFVGLSPFKNEKTPSDFAPDCQLSTGCGTFGDFGCFSFYVTKNITTGEGGMVVCKDEVQSSKIKRTLINLTEINQPI